MNAEAPALRLDSGLGLFAIRVVTVLLLLAALAEALYVVPPALSRLHVTWGMDFRLYVEHATRWVAGEGFYLPSQLAGPYVIEDVKGAAYPPVILYLLVPFVAGLPWLVWWVVPLVIIAAAIIASRPAPWQWLILVAILVYPRTWTVIVLGNPAMWALAALAAGMVWKWPAVGVLLKLTYAPLAFVGIRDRRWWLALGIGLLLALPFGLMWVDFLSALRFAQTSRGLEYTIGEWPIAIALVVGLWRATRPTW